MYYVINEKDKPIINNLQEIKYKFLDDKVSFVVEFLFKQNEFFSDTLLSKTFIYEKKLETVYKTEATPINWLSQDKIPNKAIHVKKVKSI